MSVADGELSTVLPANNSEPSMTPPTTSYRSRITLETLPNELISAIVLRLGSFILPPLSKRLLPFHRSQLYRKVTLDLTSYHSFKESVESNKELDPFVESLILNFDSRGNRGTGNGTDSCSETSPGKIDLSLRNLKTLVRNVNPRDAIENYPSRFDFDKNPRLEKYLVRSFFYEAEHFNREHESSVFDWWILPEYAGEGWPHPSGVLFEEQSDPMIVLELERIDKILRKTPISKLELVSLSHQVHIHRLLANLGTPSLLTQLKLFSFDHKTTDLPRETSFLSRFPNLTHLSLGGTALPNSSDFYDSLRSLSLVSLHLGPHTPVQIQPLIDLLSNDSRSKPTTFKHLVLDNIDAREFSEEDEEDDEVEDWVFPEWTTACSKEKVGELRELAKKLEIEVDGTTFKGLDMTRTAAYRAALEREEEESEEEEEEEEDFDSDPDGYIQLHEEICGCHRDYD